MRLERYKDKYYVSDEGHVYSKKNGGDLKLKGVKNGKGYSYVALSINGKVKKYGVHRMVAELYCENPDHKPHVNHKDGNKENNEYTNLEWCTPMENTNNAFHRGVMPLGENNHSSKLNTFQVYKILDMIKAGHKDTEIGAAFGVHRRTISDIRNGKTWKHITGHRLPSGRYEVPNKSII